MGVLGIVNFGVGLLLITGVLVKVVTTVELELELDSETELREVTVCVGAELGTVFES